MAAATTRILIAKGRPLDGDLDGDTVRCLTHLRDRPEFEGSFGGDRWWIRADCSAAKDTLRILSLIPNAELFYLDERQRLIPIGKSVPVDVLPAGIQWKPISQLSRLWLPQSQTCGKGSYALPSPCSLQWQPSEGFRTPGGLLCRFCDWRSLVLNNIQSKWRGLRFAYGSNLTGQFDTLVLGSPIPSIRGVRLVDCGRILIPIAFEWVPAVPVDAIRLSLNIAESDWLLWEREASIEIMSDSLFLPTTRVTIRATENAIQQATSTASLETRFQ